MGNGVPARVANLVFDIHGDKHERAHGAVARPAEGNHGLVPGGAFAAHILQVSLAEARRQCPVGRPRDSDDDITLQVDAKELCVWHMNEALEAGKEPLFLIIWSSVTTHQVFGLTRAMHHTWESLGCAALICQMCWGSATAGMLTPTPSWTNTSGTSRGLLGVYAQISEREVLVVSLVGGCWVENVPDADEMQAGPCARLVHARPMKDRDRALVCALRGAGRYHARAMVAAIEMAVTGPCWGQLPEAGGRVSAAQMFVSAHNSRA